MMSGDGGKGAMTVTNGLYTIQIEMTDGGHGRANGVIVLHDGKIAGGDSYFYYTGSYRADRGKWRGELITNEHTKSAGACRCSAAAKSPAALPAPIPPTRRK